jgi:hypothetical protein
MAVIATHNAPPFATQIRTLLSVEVLVRFALVPVAIAICYCFHWRALRFLTSELNMRLDWLGGIHLERVSYDMVRWRGLLYRYENACTFVDVWFGCLPLLWDLRRRLTANLAFFATLAVALFAFNVVRLSFSDVLFAVGIPWDLAHNAVSGIAYFVVWVAVWRLRPF